MFLTYTWEQESALHRSYIVRDGAGVAGRLHWLKRWDNVARADHGGESWILERRGVLSPTATIRVERNNDEVARLERKGLGGGGTLTLQNHLPFQWKPKGMFSSDWRLIEPATEHVLVTATASRSFPRDKGEVHIAADQLPAEAVVPLTYFSLYLVVLTLSDAAVAAS